MGLMACDPLPRAPVACGSSGTRAASADGGKFPRWTCHRRLARSRGTGTFPLLAGAAWPVSGGRSLRAERARAGSAGLLVLEGAGLHGHLPFAGDEGVDLACPAEPVVAFVSGRSVPPERVDIDHGDRAVSLR
jgi:hypothetical protein